MVKHCPTFEPKMYLKVTVASFILLLLGTLVGFLAFPMLLQTIIRRQINLNPNSDTRKIWEKLPFPMSFKIYVFNVSNTVDIENGGKPNLQEVGPFVFEEWKDKYDIEDIEEENAISFNMRNTFNLRADLGLSGEEVITIPHPVLQFMAISVQRQKSEAFPNIAMGLEKIFESQGAFITGKFIDIFYRGIDINCANNHPAAQAVCQSLVSVSGVMPYNDTHFKFSLLAAGNHSNAGRYKISRNITTIGQILLFNGQAQLQVWPDLRNDNSTELDGNFSYNCNQLRGTDGTFFPPYMHAQQGLWSYSPQLCRSLSPKLIGRTKYGPLALPALRYELDLGNPGSDSEPELHCFCNDYPADCPAAGTMDLTRCTGTPLVVSLPHFYKAHAELLSQVNGLEPKPQNHSTVFIYERLSGTLLSVHNRLQFSLSVEPVPAVSALSKLRKLIMPMFWIEESVQLKERFTVPLYQQIFAPLKTNNVLRWMAIILGCLGCALGGLMLHMRRNDKRVGNQTKAVHEAFEDM